MTGFIYFICSDSINDVAGSWIDFFLAYFVLINNRFSKSFFFFQRFSIKHHLQSRTAILTGMNARFFFYYHYYFYYNFFFSCIPLSLFIMLPFVLLDGEGIIPEGTEDLAYLVLLSCFEKVGLFKRPSHTHTHKDITVVKLSQNGIHWLWIVCIWIK